jgi:hypothetical protein
MRGNEKFAPSGLASMFVRQRIRISDIYDSERCPFRIALLVPADDACGQGYSDDPICHFNYRHASGLAHPSLCAAPRSLPFEKQHDPSVAKPS